MSKKEERQKREEARKQKHEKERIKLLSPETNTIPADDPKLPDLEKAEQSSYLTKPIAFSFRYAEIDSKKHSAKKMDKKQLLRLIKKMGAMGQLPTWGQILGKNDFHMHEVDWPTTKEKKGFHHLPNKLQEMPPFQFGFGERERVYGFINDHNAFEVVWFDRTHSICSQS